MHVQSHNGKIMQVKHVVCADVLWPAGRLAGLFEEKQEVNLYRPTAVVPFASE